MCCSQCWISNKNCVLEYVHVYVCVRMCASMRVYCMGAYGHVHACMCVYVCIHAWVDVCCRVCAICGWVWMYLYTWLRVCLCVRAYMYAYECISVCLDEETPRVHTRFPLHQLDRNTTISYRSCKFSRHTPLPPGNILRIRFENSPFKYHLQHTLMFSFNV